MKLSTLFTVLLLFSCFSPSFAARKLYLRVGRTTDLPSIGLKMKMPRDCVAKPMGFLSVKTLTASRAQETVKVETFFPEELWIRDQLVGQYGSEFVTVGIYDMNLPPPTGVPVLHKQDGHTYVLKEAYDKWKEEQQTKKWDEGKTISWLKYLLGPEIPDKLEKMIKGARNAVTYRMMLDKPASTSYVYVISPYKRPDKHFVVIFHVASGLDPKRSARGIEQCLASMTLYTPKKAKADAKRITTGTKSNPKKKNWSPEYIASRERVINNIKNLKGWWYLETPNFIMVANIKNKKTIRELHTNLEKSRDVFSIIYPIKQPLKAVSVAKSFETRAGYISYVGKQYEWTGGLWMPDRKELVVSPMNWGSVKDRRKVMVEVIQHEGFHQYIFFAAGEQTSAVWFNEGNATFFEGVDFKGRRPVIEETSRLAMMQGMAGSADIPNLLSMDYEEFYGGSKGRNYTNAYGLMFFLHKGAPVMKKKNDYSEIPTKYYDALIKTKNMKKATEIAWYGVDMAEFTKDFREFWRDKKLIKKAIRYDIIKAKQAKK